MPPDERSRNQRRRGMRRSFVGALLLGLLMLVPLGMAACGGGGGGAKKGGTLTMLTNGDVDDNLDPGYSYYQLDFIYNYAVERPAISYKPTDLAKASPDLAASYPTLSKEDKTLAINLSPE